MIGQTRSTSLIFGAIVLLGAFTAHAQTRDAVAEPAPLATIAGVTAVSGRVVDLNGVGLADIFVSDHLATTRTDALGRYMLAYVPAGASVLRIDGRHAGPKHATDYGIYEVRIEATSGRTTVLKYKHWLPQIDHAHDVAIVSPTAADLVVTTPAIPDFELHIPAGTVITELDGKPATHIGITALPSDRTPIPLRVGMHIPVMFTLQPGAACLRTAAGGKAYAQIWYPNATHELPKARATFWRYEPDGSGWAPRGTGTVSADGRFIVPDAGSEISDFGSAECDPRTRSMMDPPKRLRVGRPPRG